MLIASAGLGLALLGSVFAYSAGAQVLGEHYNLAIQPLIQAGSICRCTPVRLAFLLALLGYGTKVGLFPVHTWLPDAHSEAPTPVSALLSGSLLAVGFYAILRFYQVAAATLGSGFPRDALLAFGVASLLLTALYVFGQRDVKRLLAYSSVEHMGILAIGVSFGAPVALAHLRYASDIIEVVETYVYRPALGVFTAVVAAAKRLQSGRLDAYLLYMLIALIAVIAVAIALA